MITHRSAEKADIPEIVELLKKSLGESLMPKSVEYWQWKHVDNPFGESPVLLACDKERIVGVRAFMQWKWRKNSTQIQAIRAVDTATDPNYQGKGIFKSLTLQLLEKCESDKVDIVFNTPNTQSMPGYLKMGWQQAGKLPVKLSIRNPVDILLSRIRNVIETGFLQLDTNDFDVQTAINNFHTESMSPDSKWSTPYTKDYLKWRYIDIPIIRYYGLSSRTALVVFRLKQSSYGNELRICESLGPAGEVKDMIKLVFNKLKFDYMSVAGSHTGQLPGLLNVRGAYGPMVTVRELYRKDSSEFIGFSNWAPVFGDLEVF